MKKKLLISLVLCLIFVFAFALAVSAEETVCEHKYDKWTVTLGNEGFLGDITAKADCTVCKETKTEIIPKIFITRGYSYSDDGITQGYGVNRTSLARYEELSGEKVKFGAVVALKSTIGAVSPLDQDANPISDKVKTYDYTETEYSVISVSIKGIPGGVKETMPMMCAFYINAGGRNTYLDNGAEKTVCDAKTYTEIASDDLKPDETKLEEYAIIDGKRYHEITIQEMGFVQGKFWNGTTMQTGANAAFDNKFWTTKKFTKETLPIGSIIMIDSANDWQYRPHKWNGTRPKNTKTEIVVVDEAWWGNFSNVGFNISMYDGNGPTEDTGVLKDISGYTVEQIAKIFKIYIPATYAEVDWSTPDVGGNGGNEGGTTPDVGGNGGNEGGTTPDVGGDTEEDEEVIIPGTDYSDVKQNWNDDGELKILAIGNSFSDDAMDHVYKVAIDAGIEKVTLGKLYIGGCSLATHLSNAQNNKSAYDYKINTAGSWVAQGNKSIKYAVESDDWDFITFQQVSGYSGVADSYDDLIPLINIVEPLNPSARLAWHMTWAYSANSSHSDYSKYDKDQMTMYNAIVNAVNKKILTNYKIDVVIPSGTAVQNVRTSFIGDTTRDGYHLSYGIGRYIAAMTFVKALTGLSIDNSITRPDDVDSYELEAIIESVNNAIKTPYSVTTSSYPVKQGGTGGDDSANAGVIPEGYVQLTANQMGLTWASFYNTAGSSSWEAYNDTWATSFMATKKFTREELPVGSIIEIAVGWQYRPEGWKSTGTRPDNVTTLRIVIDADWWGSYSERAFNISMVGNSVNSPKVITVSRDTIANTIFKIIVPASAAPEDVEPDVPYVDPTTPPTTDPETPVDPEPETPVEPETPTEPEVPVEPEVPETQVKPTVKSSDCVEEVTIINGKEYRALTLEAMGFIKSSFYNSSNTGPWISGSGSSGLPAQYFATKLFTQDELPVGSIIYAHENWMYRPEGWKGEATNGSNRPGEVTDAVYNTVTESWWSTFTQRAFNIKLKTSSSLVSFTPEGVYESFKIYIPVENIID